MSLFKKPKKKMQMRILNTDDDDDDNHCKTINIHDNKDNHKKKKDYNKQTTPLLSFGDEVEGDAESFQVRKSSQSKRLQKQRDRERKEKHGKSLSPPPAPIISLKQEDNNIYNNKKQQSSSLEGIVLSGRAALTAGKDDISPSDDDDDDADHDDNNIHTFKHTDKSVRALLDSGAIPDAALIYAARKKRQQAREVRDYIPIENNNGETRITNNTNRREGRLVREDGAGDGSDEDAERIEVCGVAPDQKKQLMKIAAKDRQIHGSDVDSDNEEWETQQIRKAVTHNQIIAAQQETYYSNQQYSMPILQKQQDLIELNPFAVNPSLIVLSDHLRPLTNLTETLTVSQLITALHSRRNQLSESKAKKEQNLDEINNELERLSKLRNLCVNRGPTFSKKYAFYQKLRGYLTELIECLDEKMPVICSLEARSLALMKRKAAFLCERRRADIRDQANEVLIKTSGMKKDAKDEEQSRRAAEREGRRLRRRRMREQDESASLPHRDGDSSDNEVPQIELTAYETLRDKIVSDSNEVFNDTLEEYASMACVLQQMELWRNEDKSAYIEAYATSCLPKLAAPYLRHKLLLWNPITDDSAPDWEGMQWYRGLMLFGLSEDLDKIETEETLLSDPDICLIPNVIHIILLPKLTELVEGTWEPMSSMQSRKLSQLVKRAAGLPGVTSSSAPLQSLVAAIVKKVHLALQYDIFIPIVADSGDSKMNSAVSFLRRQSWSAVKLLNNIASFSGTLADGALAPLAITSLLQRYLLTAIKCSSPIFASELCERIVQCLPRSWLQRTEETAVLQQLLASCQHVLSVLTDNPLHLKSVDKIRDTINTIKTNMNN